MRRRQGGADSGAGESKEPEPQTNIPAVDHNPNQDLLLGENNLTPPTGIRPTSCAQLIRNIFNTIFK